MCPPDEVCRAQQAKGAPRKYLSHGIWGVVLSTPVRDAMCLHHLRSMSALALTVTHTYVERQGPTEPGKVWQGPTGSGKSSRQELSA